MEPIKDLEVPIIEHPKVVGRWKVLDSLGEGGMGAVFRAQHEVMDKVAAVKFLHPQLMSSGQALARFQREARAANQLNHPNVVSVFDCGVTDDGWAFQVMEHIEGRSLSEVLKTEQRLELVRACKIFIQICDALHHAHNKSVIHRDLKPSNVMLVSDSSRKDTVKIVDFGIAKVLNTSSSSDPAQLIGLTAKGQVFGSPHYMSPEQCMAQEIDARSDVYAMGCLMYETLTGLPPFMGKSYLETMSAQMNQDTPNMVAPQIAEKDRARIESIVRKALEKERDSRYQSMEALKDDLSKLLLQIDPQARSSRNKWIFVAIAAVAVVSAGIAVGVALYPKTSVATSTTSSTPAPVDASTSDPLDKLANTKDRAILWFIWSRPYARPGVQPKDYYKKVAFGKKLRDDTLASAEGQTTSETGDSVLNDIKLFASYLRESGHYGEAALAYNEGYIKCKKLFEKLDGLSGPQVTSDKRLASLRCEEAYCYYLIGDATRDSKELSISDKGKSAWAKAKEIYDAEFPTMLKFKTRLEENELDRHLIVASEINLELNHLETADKYLSQLVERSLENGTRAPRKQFAELWAHASCLRGDLQKRFRTKYSVFGELLPTEPDLTPLKIYNHVNKELISLQNNGTPRPDLRCRALWLLSLYLESKEQFKSAGRLARDAENLLEVPKEVPSMNEDAIATLTALICRDRVRILKHKAEGEESEDGPQKNGPQNKRIKKTHAEKIADITHRALTASKKYHLESVWWSK